ncbi:TMV resistance protein N [Cryptomeria japonica]|uniref:TMV resistance protein N n=1 Tax=Cryptomeria japonica TaxID=3369 RepID=UPI0027D9CFC0|nr:TMV resistance protein N [Cryptomeria japonica]
MESSSSSHWQNQGFNAFSRTEPDGNHRGPDVKQTIATQLYNSLKKVGIRAVLDSEEKELGDSFPSTIETAIKSASVHIAIFSKRYEESAWCLAELVLMLQSKAKIMKMRRGTGRSCQSGRKHFNLFHLWPGKNLTECAVATVSCD